MLGVVASCTGDDPNAVPSGADAGADDSAAGPALAIVSVEPLAAAPGRVLKAKIVIERRMGLTGAVRVKIDGVPSAVTIPGFDIPDGATESEISVNGTAAQIPARTTVAVEATVGEASARSDVPLVVRGIPGSVDTTRSPSGRHNVTFTPYAVAQDRRGRIWIGGARSSLGSCEIERHLPTGELDPSFGSGGILVAAAAPGTRIGCTAFAFSGDKLVVVGSETTLEGGMTSQGLVMRLGEDGQPDPTFGEGGRRRFPSGFGSAVGVDPQGGIRVGAANGAEAEPFLVRLDPSGTIVGAPEFLAFGENDEKTWAFRPDGSARVVCLKSDEGTRSIGLGGWDANGAIDPLFGKPGLEAPLFRSKRPNGYHTALAIDARGRIVFGPTVLADSGPNYGPYLMRFDADKPPAERWQALTTVHYDPPTGFTSAVFAKLAIAPDEKILAVGHHSTGGSGGELFVSRFDENGAPDLTFAPTGVVVYKDIPAYPQAMELQPDGALIVLQASGSPSAVLRIWL